MHNFKRSRCTSCFQSEVSIVSSLNTLETQIRRRSTHLLLESWPDDCHSSGSIQSAAYHSSASLCNLLQRVQRLLAWIKIYKTMRRKLTRQALLPTFLNIDTQTHDILPVWLVFLTDTITNYCGGPLEETSVSLLLDDIELWADLQLFVTWKAYAC